MPFQPAVCGLHGTFTAVTGYIQGTEVRHCTLSTDIVQIYTTI